MEKLTAKNIMSPDVVWINEDMPVGVVAEMFLKENITGMPVVDDENTMTGVVSLRDIVQNGLRPDDGEIVESGSQFYSVWLEEDVTENDVAQLQGETARQVTVKDIMTPLVFSVKEDTPIHEMADTMVRGRIHRLLVTNEADELTGIVTSLDMIKVLRDMT